MALKDLLNEFEYDWAAFPAMQKKFPSSGLKNKTVTVAGSNEAFDRCVLYSLFASNDLHKLNMQIIYAGCDSSALSQNIKLLLKREDFKFFTLSQLENENTDVKTDFVIYTGCCNKSLTQSPEFFFEQISLTKRILSLAEEMKAERFVLLSDYRSYGIVEHSVVISEFENGTADFSRASSLEFELINTIESLCASYARQGKYSYVVLRTAIILGAYIGFDDSIITDLFSAVASGKEYTLINSKNKYSFVYISDVLNAVYSSLTTLKANTVYNVVGKKSTVSTGMLCAMLHDLFPDDTKVTLEYSEKDPCYGAAMNNQKIIAFGCKPRVTLEDAIQLTVKSLKDSEGIFVFDDSYQGKLRIIQNILLGYLLEIDRICKKHNIKYFLAGGTLLGAIRHHGFIPWDDDADVMMLREDYDKFLSVVQSELPKGVTLHTADTDPQNHCVFTKLRLDNTFFATKWTSKHLNVHNGVFFDVLSHDNTANSVIGRKIHLQLTLLTRSLVFNKWYNRKINNKNKVQSGFANVLKKILPMSVCEKLQYKCLKWFKDKKDAKYLYDGMGRNVYKGDFPKEYLKDVIYWDFEGYRFPIPKEYDNYLKYLYGNYNDMVIASARKNSHSIVVMDLGEYAHYKRPRKSDITQRVVKLNAEQKAKAEKSEKE